MSEIINLEIKADQSGADEALKQVNKSLKEGTEAAEALSHVLDGDVAGAFKSLGELSTTLGVELGLAFSPAEIIAFVQVIAEVTDKLSKLIADTFIYTDAMKEEDKAQRSLNQRWVDSAARIKAIGREMQITAEKTQAGQDALRLKFKLEDIGGTPEKIKAAIATVQDLIKQAMTDSKPPESIADFFGNPIQDEELVEKAAKAAASLGPLNLQLSELQRELKESTAVAAQGAQVLANDLAAAAEKAAQDEQRRKDALSKAAKDRAASAAQAAIAKAEADKRSGDAEIQQKQQVIRELAAAHQISAEDELSLNKSVLEQKFAQDETALQKKLEQLKRDPERNAAQIITVQGEIKALTTQHYTELEKLNADYYKQVDHNGQEAVNKAAAKIHAFLQQIKESQQIILESAKAHDQAMGQIADQRLNFELQIGKISQANYKKQLQWEMAETYANERAKLEAKRQAAEGNLVEQAKVDAELQKLDDKYRAESEKAEQQSLLRRRQQFDQYFKQVSSSFNTALNGWIQGTETASQAFGKMFQDIISQLINFVEQWIEKKIEMWLMDKLLSETSQSASAEAQIVSNAAVAYSGAYAATAAIPIFGPGLAPAAAMMAYMDVMAITPAGFALGGIVPATGLALVHEGEKILPKSMSGDGSGLGGITVVVNHSVSAVDAASFQGHFRRHSNMIANEVTRALKRKGAR